MIVAYFITTLIAGIVLGYKAIRLGVDTHVSRKRIFQGTRSALGLEIKGEELDAVVEDTHRVERWIGQASGLTAVAVVGLVLCLVDWLLG